MRTDFTNLSRLIKLIYWKCYWKTQLGIEFLSDEIFQFDAIDGKFADAIAEFIGGHLVFVEHPAEGFFVQR